MTGDPRKLGEMLPSIAPPTKRVGLESVERECGLCGRVYYDRVLKGGPPVGSRRYGRCPDCLPKPRPAPSEELVPPTRVEEEGDDDPPAQYR